MKDESSDVREGEPSFFLPTMGAGLRTRWLREDIMIELLPRSLVMQRLGSCGIQTKSGPCMADDLVWATVGECNGAQCAVN